MVVALKPIDWQPLRERIRYYYGRRVTTYHGLLRACFPPDLHPRAWNTSTRGGPPGCARAFGSALRRLGLRVEYFDDVRLVVGKVTP